MATDLTNLVGNITLNVGATAEKADTLSTARESLSYYLKTLLDFGSTGSKVNQIFTDTRTIAASGFDNIDLYGTLLNAFGTTINFASIKALVIVNKSTDATCILEIGSGNWAGWLGSTTFYELLNIGGTIFKTDPAGIAVTTSTHDILKIANMSSTETATFDIIIIGVSA